MVDLGTIFRSTFWAAPSCTVTIVAVDSKAVRKAGLSMMPRSRASQAITRYSPGGRFFIVNWPSERVRTV